MVPTKRDLYNILNRNLNMSETDAKGGMSKYSERVIKVRIPLQSDEDLNTLLEETTRKFGRKLKMADIETVLKERYGG